MKLDKNTFYMAEDLFRDVIEEVKRSGKWPEELIDYALPYSFRRVPLWNYEFDPVFVLQPGGSEGYYLDLAIRGAYGPERNENEYARLGTIKTLGRGEETVRRMAALYGECLVAYEKVMLERLDDITRVGFDIDFYIGEKYAGGLVKFSGRKEAETRVKEAFTYRKEITCAAICDNLSREIMRISR